MGGPAIRRFNWSGQPCGSTGLHPCGDDGPAAGGGWFTVCGGPEQRPCNPAEWSENMPYTGDGKGTTGYADTPVGNALRDAAATLGVSGEELIWMRDAAKAGNGPPIPGFNADGSLVSDSGGIANNLSPLGWSVAGLAIGAVAAAFVGYPWYYGAPPGAVAGYLYGRTQ